jgi:diadenosine tetraphosphate (Ap4A) HIT family hydrolase
VDLANQCITCELIVRRDEGKAPLWDCIHRTQYWDIVHCNSTSLAGWLIIIARRHIAAVDEMTEEEAIEAGKLIRQVSLALKEQTGCIKAYIAQFAEAPGHQHVHFHIVPRMADQPEGDRGSNIFRHLGVPAENRVSETIMNEIALVVKNSLIGL